MRLRNSMPTSLVIGLPVLLLAVGGGAGWLTRDTSDESTGSTQVAAANDPLPGSFVQVAPLLPLPDAANAAVVDPASIIGLDTSTAQFVPADAALALPLAVGETATAVDATTYQPLAAAGGLPAAVAFPVDPTPTDSLAPVVAAPSTLAPPNDAVVAAPTTVAPGTVATPGDVPIFRDRCTFSSACAGAPAAVRPEPADAEGLELAPLVVSTPAAGAAGFADVCRDVEGPAVPDPFLSAATRPTVAVLVNQPSTLALTGTWADGTPLAKTTMVTLPAHDAEWRRAWEQDKVQRHIVACVTLPLEEVRAHAGGGVAEVRSSVLAISATGRAEVTGQVTLNIPIDGNDPLFVDRVTVANRGEQRLINGVLYPTVHVHYAFLSDAVVPAGTGLDPAAVRVFDHHALVEGADCSGWAVNQQGRSRTAGGSYDVTIEQRSVAGRDRTVTVVDGEVYLDPTLPGGWQGHFCVRLAVTDNPEEAADRSFTLALRGNTVRGPRSADYAVSVLLDDPAFPADWALQTTWAAANALGRPGLLMCNTVELAGDSPGASCASSARLAPDGIVVSLKAIDPAGDEHPVVAVLVPVNTAACNPDDPFGFVSNGCDTGFTRPLALRFDGGDELDSVRVVVQVDRTAQPGGVWQDPSHAWKLGAVTSFPF